MDARRRAIDARPGEIDAHNTARVCVLDAFALTSQYSPPNWRITNVTSRYWQYRLHAPVREPGDADDAGAGIFLRRTRRSKECAGHHDAELRFDGMDHGPMVGLWILGLLLGRSQERHGL